MKRKTTAASAAPPTKKKKPSVLLGKPQNVYVAPSSMTGEELSAWRKEERRKRNRASAAASRHKTQSKISDLETQVSLWKTRCEEMQEQMLQLQRQIDITRAQSPTQEQQQLQHLVSPPSSHPNSPSSMSLEGQPPIVTSSLATKKFLPPPPLMLSPASLMDQTSSPVENKTDITSSSNVDLSKKHLNMISRQA